MNQQFINQMLSGNGLNSNFHNFFTNDSIFGSPQPDSSKLFGMQNKDQPGP